MGVGLGWRRMHSSNPYISGQAWSDKVTRSGNTVSYSLNLCMKVEKASGYWDYIWYVDMQVGSNTSNNRKVKNNTSWHQIIGGKEYYQSTFNGNFTGSINVSGKATSIQLRAQFHDSNGNRGPNVYWNVPIPTATSMDDIKKEVSGVGSDIASISAKVTKTGNYSTITSWKLEYGVRNYSENVKTISGNNLSVNWLLENLLADTNYEYRITVSNSSGYSKQATGVFRTEEEVIGYRVTKGELIEPGVYEDGEASGEFVQIDNTYENEGQITSVEMLGNATQNGTPTPDSPQPISVVTGEQTIKVEGKNLLDITQSSVINQGTYVSGANTSTYTIKATGNDLFVNAASAAGASYASTKGNLISCNYGETIYFNVGNNNFQKNYFTEWDENLLSLGYTLVSSSSGTYTPTRQGCKYVIFRFGNGYSVPDTTYTLSPIVCKTSDTSFEPYQGQSYEINLGGNLFDRANASENKLLTWAAGTLIDEDKAITSDYISASDEQQFSSNYIAYIFCYDSSKTYLGAIQTGSTTIAKTGGGIFSTFTIPSGHSVAYIRVVFRSSANSNLDMTQQNIMLNYGSTALPYTPYTTYAYELAKIGTYQDRIYKENGKWYLHKEIGKVVFDGSENWSLVNSGASNFYYNLPVFVTPKDQDIMPVSNYFVGTPITNGNTSVGLWITNAGTIRARKETEQTLAGFKTWLGTALPSVYYVLATPTTTEITNSELVGQLERLGVATLYVGLNNVLVATNNVAPTLKIDYKLTVKEPVYDDRSDELVGWIIYPDGRKKKIKEIRRVYPT